MSVNCIWDKLTKLTVFCLFITGVVAVALWYLPLIQQNERMRRELMHKEAQVKAEDELNRSLQASLQAARSNPKTIERMAREGLGYAKPDEIVIRFEEPSKR